MDEDAYFHKYVTFLAWKQNLRFRVSQGLFSSYDIDTGTRFLLRTVFEAGYQPQCILDLGCGYGPLGLTLKSLHPESVVHMVDRDALAVDYSRQNAELNGLSGVEIYGSLGYDDVKPGKFDLIVANIPGKAGEPVITHLLREAGYYLAPGGLAAVVVVAPLEDAVAKILGETPGAEIVLRRNRSGHAVFHYKFNDEGPAPEASRDSIERGVYHRIDVRMKVENIEYAMQTASGLPEFDSLSYGTRMLVKALAYTRGMKVRRASVFNPGQGHVPVAVWKSVKPDNISLVDRDLLALRYSRLNLVRNGCPADIINASHGVGIEPSGKKADLVIGALREDEGRDANLLMLDRAAEQLAGSGLIIVSAGSTAVTRLVAHVESTGRLRVRARERWKGNSLLVLQLN